MSEASKDQVLSIVANIKKNIDNTPTTKENVAEEVISSNRNDKNNSDNIVKGKPKSGKFWKSNRERFSSINKTKGLKADFSKKTALRLELQRTKELSKQAMNQIQQKQLERKDRRREKIKKTEENKKKAEIVQVITNTAKLKRMRKKQLRFIEKRDTNKPVDASK